MKYLGIDYGLRKIGLAVSDGQIASIYSVLKINGLKDAVSKVRDVLRKEEIEIVVVGLSESGESRKIAKFFIKELKTHKVEVVEVDETLSTFDAQELMHSIGVKDKKKEDAYSAALILQNFLDKLQ